MAKKTSTKELISTIARQEIRNNVSAEDIINEIEKESDGHKENQEYFGSVTSAIEVAVNGVTNRIALMIDGKIPADYKDLADLYRKVKVSMAQLKAIADKAKQFIIDDPMAPDSFYVNGVSFTLESAVQKRFNKDLFKKDDPVNYALIYTDPRYQKEVTVNKLSFKAMGGK